MQKHQYTPRTTAGATYRRSYYSNSNCGIRKEIKGDYNYEHMEAVLEDDI